MNPPDLPTKPARRRDVLAARRATSPPARARADAALVAGAVRLARGAACVAAHVPMPGEPGGTAAEPAATGPSLAAGPRQVGARTDALVDALAAVVGVLLLPVLLPDRDLDWARYVAGTPLLASPAGGLLREPPGARLGPDAVAGADLVLVPALAVDRAGVRLGRGGGSYDRALARVPRHVPVVALVYESERYDVVPEQPHDRRVSAILTPSGLTALPDLWLDDR
jgi:5-formyltetrahydrofolate cyclo-ligase